MASTTTLRQRFEDLVKKAEAEVAADPATYRWKLAALAALGYAVIFGLLATLIGILGGTVFIALSSTALFVLLLKNKLFLLLLVPIWVLLSRNKDEIGQTLAKEIPQVLTLPGTWYFIPDVSDYRAVAKKIKAVGQAMVV